jgi:hypothetical protein
MTSVGWIPAFAGMTMGVWIPAFAGMTEYLDYSKISYYLYNKEEG